MSNFNTPKGRIVGGSLSKPQTTDYYDKPLDKPKYVVMLAIPKTDPGLAAIVDHIKAIGVAGYAKTPGQSDRVDFAWKMIDGDSEVPNRKGDRPCTKEGYKGHTVFVFETTWAFQVCGPDLALIDAGTVSQGDYIEICGEAVSGTNTDNPGVFLNLKAAKFVEKGEPIGGGISAAAAFGGTPPVAPAAAPPVAPAAAPPVAPAAAPPVAPAAAPPATDLVDAVAPPVPAVPAAPPAPPTGPVLTEKGKAAGCDPLAWAAAPGSAWSLEVQKQQGYIE